MAKRKWMQAESAREEKAGTKGSFTAYCESHGYDGATAECIAYAMKHGDTKTKRRAQMAQRFAQARKGKQKRTQRKEFQKALHGQRPRKGRRRR